MTAARPVHVVLDIDSVLACINAQSDQEASFFLHNGAIIQAIKTHYIFPGVIEFLQLLFQMDHIRVSFFSAGSEKRNKTFVNQLLKIVLPQKKYKKTRKNVLVFSKDYLASPGLKKDLTIVLEDPIPLEDTILIDDRLENRASDQFNNLLWVPPTDLSHFRALEISKVYSYTEGGVKLSNCIMVCIPLEEFLIEEGNIENMKGVLILRTNDGFELGFLDKDSYDYRQEKLSEEKHSSLIERLAEVYKHETTGCFGEIRSFSIHDPHLCQDLCNLITSLNGISRKICRSVNRIYYVTGILFRALETSKRLDISLSEALFKVQYSVDEEDEEPVFDNLHKADVLYHLGLSKLRSVNPQLEFTTPEKYTQHVYKPVEQKELSQLDRISLTNKR